MLPDRLVPLFYLVGCSKKHLWSAIPLPQLARRKWGAKKSIWTPAHPAAPSTISKPLWHLHRQHPFPHEHRGSPLPVLQHLPRKTGNVSLIPPQSQGNPNVPRPRRVFRARIEFCLCSVSTQRQSEGNQLSSKRCSAVVSRPQSILWIRLICHPGRTNLPWNHLLLPPSQRAEWDSSDDWMRLPTRGNTDFWASPLSVAETSHYSHQSFRDNSAQPKVEAFGWMMPLPALTKLHRPRPRPPFSRRAGWVSGSGFESACTPQYLRVLHFRCCNCPSLTPGVSRDMQCKWISQNPTSFHLQYSTIKQCTIHPPSSHPCRLQIHGTPGRTTLSLLSLSSSPRLLQRAVFALRSLCAAERTAGLGIRRSSLQKCLSALNTLGGEWGSDSHLYRGSMKQE